MSSKSDLSTSKTGFKVPLNAISVPTLVLTPDFTMVAANNSRLEVTATTLEEIIGRNIFEVFPDNPNDPSAEGVRNLRASLERVLRDKVADTMSVQKYDIPIPGTNPTRFEERYWSPTNIPVLDENGWVTHILHQVQDVTAAIKSQGKQDAMAFEIYKRTEEVRAINVELKLAKAELERKVAERTKQLKESESRLLQATASADVGLWEIDAKTGRAWRSASHDRLLGYSTPPAEWTFDQFKEHIYPDDRAKTEKVLSFERDDWETEFRVIRADGQIRCVSLKGVVQRNKSGDAIGASGVIFDITEKKQAQTETEVERQKFEAIFHEAPAALALMRGSDLVFEKVNARYQKMMGDRDLVGREFSDAFPELHDQPFEGLLKKVYETGEPYLGNAVKARMVRRPGSQPEETYWDFAYIRIPDEQGKPYGIYHHAYDVTDRILYRMRLEEAQKELVQAKEIAETASRMKSAFVANMSHEIRTPLAAIIGFTDLLKEGGHEPQEREQFLDTISRSGRALTRLIDDILDLAKVEAGHLDIETVDFSMYELLSDSVELFREKARQKGIYLFLSIAESAPVRIGSDPSRLRQILVNLIGNAIKFTDRGGVRVNVDSAHETDGKIRFTVDIQDSGIGLSDEQRQNLFQPFAQADNTTTRKYGGTGLGLALSRRLSEALGGSISINQCAPGEGCTFRLTFVASEVGKTSTNRERTPSPQEPMASSQQTELLTGVKVLAVDDALENLLLVKRVLNKRGAFVETAENGEEAVEKALASPFDIVLMDIQMPRMDGYQAKKILDEHGYTRPVLALTAHAMAEERTKTKNAGFAAHLTKPLNNQELIETVARLVRETRPHPLPVS